MTSRIVPVLATATVARIESSGATVVEAPEDDLARRCVAAYLSAKARAKV